MRVRRSILLVVASIALLLGGCESGRSSSEPHIYRWGDVTFTYPGAFEEGKGDASEGMDEALIFKGFMYESDKASGVFFSAFDLPAEIRDLSRDELTAALETLRSSDSKAAVSVTVAGLPGLSDEWHAAKALNNRVVTRKDVVLIDISGSFVFRITCQYKPEHEQAVKQACDQVLDTFTVTPNQ